MAGIIWVQEVLRDLADRALQVRSAYCIRLGLGQFSCPVRGFRRWTGSKASADLSRLDRRITPLAVSLSEDGLKIKHGNLPTQLQRTIVERLSGVRPPFDAGYRDPPIRNPILFVNLSPVEMQVIDPLGRRAGLDFATWSELAEIPNAHFWRSDAPDEPDFVFIGDPVAGPYTIRLLGLTEGTYQVGMDVFNDQGGIAIAQVSGESEPGAEYEHVLVYDPETVPASPLSLTWLPPLQEGTAIPVSTRRTLPVKFRIHDAQGMFAVDEQVTVLIMDPSQPEQALAAFTTQGPAGERIRILESAELYHLPLSLQRHPLEEGKVYRLTVYAFGRTLATVAFEVRP